MEMAGIGVKTKTIQWRQYVSFIFQDTPKVDDVDEGSADDVYGGHPLYRHDDDEEDDGSGHIRDHDYDEHEEEEDAVDNDIVNVDDEIDPRDLDIGFHEDITGAPDKVTSAKTTTSKTVPNVATEHSDPSKHEFSQETNFFAQPGIMTGVLHTLNFSTVLECLHSKLYLLVNLATKVDISVVPWSKVKFLISDPQ